MKRYLRLPTSRYGRLLLFVAFIAVLVVLGPYVISRLFSPWQALDVQVVDTIEPHPIRSVDQDSSNRELRVACYNIAHGRGLAESNSTGGTRLERKERLDDIAELLRELDADVVVLNEADFDASWSYSVNQATYLAEQAGYRHVATLRNLDFSVGHRSWDFGNAVLSRYPIVDAYEIDQPGYALWETVLAGKKRSLFCELDVEGQPVGIIAVHLSHRSEALRVASARSLLSFAEKYDKPLVLAGDFNSTPADYPESTIDENQENAMDVLHASGRFRRVPLVWMTDGSTFTFRSDNPNRIIDWILCTDEFDLTGHSIEPSLLSDHRPVISDLRLKQ